MSERMHAKQAGRNSNLLSRELSKRPRPPPIQEGGSFMLGRHAARAGAGADLVYDSGDYNRR
jgi:hypothetical protein